MSAWSDLVLSDAPLLWWRLDEAVPGTGSAADSSGAGRNGTYVASPTSVASLLPADPNAAVDFSSAGTQWITSTYNPFAVGAQKTWECWFKRGSNTTADTIWGGSQPSTQPALSALISADNISFFSSVAAAGQTWTGTLVPVGVSRHVVLTFNGTTKVSELFINGISQGTKTHSTDFDVAPGNFNLAKRSTASDPGHGSYDEVVIYGSILSPQKILEHYRAGSFLTPIARAKARFIYMRKNR